jgi:hypothetical protein
MPPSAAHSRGLSSSDTLVAAREDTRIDISITSPPNTTTSGLAQTDTADADTSQADATQTPTKKKKNKSKKKKATTDPNTNAAGPVNATPIPDADEDLDPNDPFASQFSQIDELRRAIKADTKVVAKKPEPKPTDKKPNTKSTDKKKPTAEQLQHIKAFVDGHGPPPVRTFPIGTAFAKK